MALEYQIAPAEEIPAGARVCHYDELDEAARHRFPDVAGTTTSDPAFEEAAARCDLVKFTDYYRIDRVAPSAESTARRQ